MLRYGGALYFSNHNTTVHDLVSIEKGVVNVYAAYILLPHLLLLRVFEY